MRYQVARFDNGRRNPATDIIAEFDDAETAAKCLLSVQPTNPPGAMVRRLSNCAVLDTDTGRIDASAENIMDPRSGWIDGR